jgi:hypothetical protein
MGFSKKTDSIFYYVLHKIDIKFFILYYELKNNIYFLSFLMIHLMVHVHVIIY